MHFQIYIKNYLGADVKVKSVKRAASIKKYNLIFVLFAHWMAAGCSPIKRKEREEKIELDTF